MQLSLFSAASRVPVLGDLAGLLCGQGQVARTAATAARLSVVVDDQWRANAVAGELADRGIEAELTHSGSGQPLVRTAFLAELLPLAGRWVRGAVKAVPAGFGLDGPTLRLWVLASGRPAPTDDDEDLAHAFLLGLDTRAPDTHRQLVRVAERAGLVRGAGSSGLVGPRGGGPAVRISGTKRLRTLSELVGPLPEGSAPTWRW